MFDLDSVLSGFPNPSNSIRFTCRTLEKNKSLEGDCASFVLYHCDLQERIFLPLHLRQNGVRLNLNLGKMKESYFQISVVIFFYIK